jgi:glycine/D-amino acid oxidase-like deaminating enzyme
MFPELRDVAFAYRWGGAIDTSTRFAASLISSHGGKLITINGFTGLGVGASRFFAQAALERLEGTSSPITNLSMLRKGAFPFPPEPFRFLGISLTRRSIARADRHQGRRNIWLRLLDRLGLGFDS